MIKNTATGPQWLGTAADKANHNGSSGKDRLLGDAGEDEIACMGGVDYIDGGTGDFDAAVYTDAGSGIFADLTAGTVLDGV